MHGYTEEEIEKAVLVLEGKERLEHMKAHSCCHFRHWHFEELKRYMEKAAKKEKSK